MYRTDDLVGGQPTETETDRPKRVSRKGIRMMVAGQEIVSDVPVELYLRSDLAVARAAEAMKGKSFLDA